MPDKLRLEGPMMASKVVLERALDTVAIAIGLEGEHLSNETLKSEAVNLCFERAIVLWVSAHDSNQSRRSKFELARANYEPLPEMLEKFDYFRNLRNEYLAHSGDRSEAFTHASFGVAYPLAEEDKATFIKLLSFSLDLCKEEMRETMSPPVSGYDVEEILDNLDANALLFSQLMARRIESGN